MNDLGGVGVTVPLNRSSEFNQMNINNSTHCDHRNSSALVFFTVFYCLVFMVGLLLNGFTLKVYFCRSQQKASSCVTIYLKNLAAADFLISLCLLIRIANYASSSVLVHQVFCSFGVSTFYLNMYASILFMGYIAANRYLKIVHPLGTHVLQTVRAAHIISTVTWVFLLVVVSTYNILWVYTQATFSVPNTVSCDALSSKEFSLFYNIIHTLSATIFLLVLVSLLFFYYSTSRRLSLAQQRQPASPGNKKLAKSRRNMLVLVSVFCVCFVPYHLVRLLFVVLRKQCTWSQAFFFPKELSIMMSALNVCLDPLIYFIFSKAFRAQLSPKKISALRRSQRRNEALRGGAEQTPTSDVCCLKDIPTQQKETTTSASSTYLPQGDLPSDIQSDKE